MTRNYPDLGGPSDWMKQIPIQSEVLGIFVLFPHMSFCRETISSFVKGRLFLSMKPYEFHRKQKENRTKITSWMFNPRLLTAYPQQGWP